MCDLTWQTLPGFLCALLNLLTSWLLSLQFIASEVKPGQKILHSQNLSGTFFFFFSISYNKALITIMGQCCRKIGGSSKNVQKINKIQRNSAQTTLSYFYTTFGSCLGGQLHSTVLHRPSAFETRSIGMRNRITLRIDPVMDCGTPLLF